MGWGLKVSRNQQLILVILRPHPIFFIGQKEGNDIEISPCHSERSEESIKLF